MRRKNPSNCPNFKPLKNPRPWPRRHGTTGNVGKRTDEQILGDLIYNVDDDLQALHDFCVEKGYL